MPRRRGRQKRAAKQNGDTTASTTACPASALPLAAQLVSVWPQPTVQFWIQGRLCCSRIKVWRHSHFVGAGRRRPLRSGLLSSGSSICSCRSRDRASSCAAKLLHRNGGQATAARGAVLVRRRQHRQEAAGKEGSIEAAYAFDSKLFSITSRLRFFCLSASRAAAAAASPSGVASIARRLSCFELYP